MSFEEKLISAVFLRPFIYNKLDKDHSKKGVKTKAWAEISKEIGRSVADCQRRWRSLKDYFYKQKKNGPSGSGSEGKSEPWIWFQSLLFLSDFNEPRSTTDNFELTDEERVEDSEINEIEDDLNDEESLSNSINSKLIENGGESKKRKKETVAEQWSKAFEKIANSDEQGANYSADPVVDTFSKYIATEMAQLSTEAKEDFKWEVMSALRGIKQKYQNK